MSAALLVGACGIGDVIDGLGVLVRGRIMGAAGPVRDAIVTLKGLNGAVSVQTDADGNYVFERVIDGHYEVEATATTTAADATAPIEFKAEESVDVAGSDLDVLPMELTGAIAGRIVLGDTAGAAVTGDSTGIAVYVPGTSFAARTDAQGRFTMLYVQPGTYAVRAEREGYAPLDVSDIVVRSAALTAVSGATLTRKADTDGDGILDEVDPDDDDDGIDDDADAFPHDPGEWGDADADGLGDNQDAVLLAGPPAIDDVRTVFEFGFGNAPPDGFASFQCRLDGAPWADCAPPQESCGGGSGPCEFVTRYRLPLGPLAEGPHNLDVRLRGSGFSDGTPMSIGWTVRAWAQISVSSEATCGVRSDGTLWCWRDFSCVPGGTAGGPEDPKPCDESQQIGTANDWAYVSVHGEYACAIKTTGSLWCWGSNFSGNLGDGTMIHRDDPVRVGTDNDWDIVATGSSLHWVQTGPGSAAGFSGLTTCAIRTNGTLWCWGYDRAGVYGGGVTGAGLCGDGNAGCTYAPAQNGGDSDWASVTMGGNHLCATKTSGAMACWGENTMGQVGNGQRGTGTAPPPVTLPAAITTPAAGWTLGAAGATSSCGARDGVGVWCWGSADGGQLGTSWDVLDDTCPQVPGFAAWCSPLPLAVPLGGETGPWRSLAGARGAGEGSASQGYCAVADTGAASSALWCWGELTGLTNQGDTLPQTIDLNPGNAGAAAAADTVSLASERGCAVDRDGALWCWGKIGVPGTSDVFGPTQQER